MTPQEFNSIDFSKLFMGFAVALIMIIQAYQGNEINSAHAKADLVNSKIVPRVEYERRHLSKMNVSDAINVDDAMTRDDILALIKGLTNKINELKPNQPIQPKQRNGE